VLIKHDRANCTKQTKEVEMKKEITSKELEKQIKKQQLEIKKQQLEIEKQQLELEKIKFKERPQVSLDLLAEALKKTIKFGGCIDGDGTDLTQIIYENFSDEGIEVDGCKGKIKIKTKKIPVEFIDNSTLEILLIIKDVASDEKIFFTYTEEEGDLDDYDYITSDNLWLINFLKKHQEFKKEKK
jgi:hypothetical protein